MIELVLRRIGRDLSLLVSADGPFTIDEWNEVAVHLGGQARRSFDAAKDELSFRLDPIVEEFDVDERISELREDSAAVKRLAQLLSIEREDLEQRLEATHGRTLLGRFVAEIRDEAEVAESHSEAPADEWDDEPPTDPGVDEPERGDAPALLTHLLHTSLELSEIGSAWPARGILSVGNEKFDVSIYARVVGGSARGNSLERRFQNPSKRSPIVDDPSRYELLLGLWIEQGDERAVIVAFDPFRRIGRTSRFSLFMPLSLLEQAADTGFAVHENGKGETLYAFRPENIGRYVQTLMDAGLWVMQNSATEAQPVERPKPPKPVVKPVSKKTDQTIYIRPRVGMYAAFARLNYKPWFALAEFVDNSIQSFLANRDRLVAAGHDGPLVIDINLDDNEISITDRAGGIPRAEFPRAFSPAAPPDDPSGLSEFGLGMKAAACWFSRRWSVRTSAFGEPVERTVIFDIPAISREGLENLPIDVRPARSEDHFTVLTMTDLRVRPRGRTLMKIKEHLASIYRVLSKEGVVKLRLTTSGRLEELNYEPPELLEAPYYKTPKSTSRLWRKEFEVDFHDKKIIGWAGILRKGSHSTAGFSVFRRRRLIEGSIGETYKPGVIFGSPNSFAYQRVIGELYVEGFDVTHTKDGIQWHGHEDEIVESIYRQINSRDCPLLDQADGYRVRKTADTLPANFGSDALTDIADSLSQPATEEAIRNQVDAPPSPEASVAATAAGGPVGPVSILQHRSLRLEILRDGKPWTVHLELIRDPSAPFYSTSVVDQEGGEVLTVQLNLDHEFSVTFINDNEAVLDPMMRLLAALALSERIARESGVKNPGTVRQQANQILRTIAAGGR